MSRCIIKKNGVRCANEALPRKRTCGQHPKARKHHTSRRSTFFARGGASSVLKCERYDDAQFPDVESGMAWNP